MAKYLTSTGCCPFTQFVMPQAAVHGWMGIQHRITCFQLVTRRLNLGSGIAKGPDNMNVVICGNGMVLLELDSLNLDANATLTGYSPRRKNDSGRLVSIIRQYFNELAVRVNEVSKPKMFFDGAFGGIYHDLSQ